MKFILVSGGVLSGLGKGVTAASIGLLLKSRGFRVTAVKCDMYLNIDAGTMNPLEHGEVFVTHDGLETDQDLGHYERFLGETLTRSNYLTSGQIYKSVLDKERALEYGGKCVEPYHHIPPEIIDRWKLAGKENKAEIVIVELGGTVGEYEGMLFFEALRRLKLSRPNDVCLVHVGYLPLPPSIGELKSKPLQQSVSFLNSLGLQPDFIVGRAEREIDQKRKEKIALASGLSPDNIFSAPDVDSVYMVPNVLRKQGMDKKIVARLGLKPRSTVISGWEKMVGRISRSTKKVPIAIVGKYQKTGDYILEDSYVCVVEALKHAGWQFGVTPELLWVDSQQVEGLSYDKIGKVLGGAWGIIVPQGWGSRGVEGKIKAVEFSRENKIPYLGLCFGMQMAVIEFARNVLGLEGANSTEVDPMTRHPVVDILPDQKKNIAHKEFGGTIRLGAWPCLLKEGSLLSAVYKKYGGSLKNVWYKPNPRYNAKHTSARVVYERHRHRYEFSNKYKAAFEKRGMVFSGMSPDRTLVEAIELKDHPFFVGTQFHPEYASRPLAPHPIFLSFVEHILLLGKGKNFLGKN
jgi:CTP synthase